MGCENPKNKNPEICGKYRKVQKRKNGGLFLVVQVHEDQKLVAVWLTREEKADDALRQHLKKLYQDYSNRKFRVAEFHSGTESLYALTRDLLLYNRRRAAELEAQAEQNAGHPNLSAGYSGSLPIQC